MKDYRESILDVHEKIEDNLDFVLDVDNLSVKKYYNMLDDIDDDYITIEDIDDEKIITLYNTEEEGFEYLNRLKELLFFIKKETIELSLKKIKMLLRRKKKKEELIIILRLLKQLEEFYQENKESFSKEKQEKIEEYFYSIKNIKDEKIVIKKNNIKDNIKLTTMIGITEVVSACNFIIPIKDKEKIVKEVKKIKKSEKIDKNIKVTKPEVFVDVVNSKKAGISDEMKNNIKKNGEETKKRQEEKEEIVNIEIIEKEEKKEERRVKEVAEVVGAISLGAATVVALPTAAKTVAAVEALKVLTENNEIESDKEEDKEIVELIEELETEDIDKKEEDILRENGLEENIQEDAEKETKEENELVQEPETLTKEERFKVLKMNFEHNEKSTSIGKRTVLRVKEEKKEKRFSNKKKENKKEENKKPISQKKSPLKNFISKIGRVAFLLSMNIALANILQQEVAKSLVVGKPKVLK